jgi:hypothetical protein
LNIFSDEKTISVGNGAAISYASLSGYSYAKLVAIVVDISFPMHNFDITRLTLNVSDSSNNTIYHGTYDAPDHGSCITNYTLLTNNTSERDKFYVSYSLDHYEGSSGWYHDNGGASISARYLVP